MPRAAAGFERQLRLLNGDQFKAVFEHKKRWHGDYFSTYIAPNDQSHPRVGLAVSRRVSKRAVQRNRIKRLVRESFRQQRSDLGNRDYVVVAKSGAAEQENTTLKAELDKLWARARRKCEQY